MTGSPALGDNGAGYIIPRCTRISHSVPSDDHGTVFDRAVRTPGWRRSSPPSASNRRELAYPGRKCGFATTPAAPPVETIANAGLDTWYGLGGLFHLSFIFEIQDTSLYSTIGWKELDRRNGLPVHIPIAPLDPDPFPHDLSHLTAVGRADSLCHYLVKMIKVHIFDASANQQVSVDDSGTLAINLVKTCFSVHHLRFLIRCQELAPQLGIVLFQTHRVREDCTA